MELSSLLQLITEGGGGGGRWPSGQNHLKKFLQLEQSFVKLQKVVITAVPLI